MVTEVPGQSYLRPQRLGDGEDILVPAPAQVCQDDLVAVHLLGLVFSQRQSRGLGSSAGNDAFGAAQQLESIQRFTVGHAVITHAADAPSASYAQGQCRDNRGPPKSVRFINLAVSSCSR
jgi:hypothetical protein